MPKGRGTRVFRQFAVLFSGQYRHFPVDLSLALHRLATVLFSMSVNFQSKRPLQAIIGSSLAYTKPDCPAHERCCPHHVRDSAAFTGKTAG